MQLPDLMKMTFRELLFWYRLQERKIVEQNIVYGYQKDDKPIPTSEKLGKLVTKEIEKRKIELRRENGIE